MSIINQLACSLDRRDEVPNKQLAMHIANTNDAGAVKELVDNLLNKNKNIQSDCIKVLDELGYLNPQLVAPYADQLVALLNNKNNRLQWGAMAALNSITNQCFEQVYEALPQIIAAADKGTVITNDHCVNILVKLAAISNYRDDCLTLLMERILKSPPNQMPTYAENTLPLIGPEYKDAFVKILTLRLPDLETEAKLKRVEKMLKKLQGTTN